MTVLRAPPFGRAPLVRGLTCSLQQQAYTSIGGSSRATTSMSPKVTYVMEVSTNRVLALHQELGNERQPAEFMPAHARGEPGGR